MQTVVTTDNKSPPVVCPLKFLNPLNEYIDKCYPMVRGWVPKSIKSGDLVVETPEGTTLTPARALELLAWRNDSSRKNWNPGTPGSIPKKPECRTWKKSSWVWPKVWASSGTPGKTRTGSAALLRIQSTANDHSTPKRNYGKDSIWHYLWIIPPNQ